MKFREDDFNIILEFQYVWCILLFMELEETI